MGVRQPLGCLRQIELDDLGRAGAHQEQRPDLRPAGQQLAGDTVEFVVTVGEARQIPFLEDGGREPWLREDHHAGGGLDQMSTRTGADDQEKCVLDLAMQPHDARQTAEHLALPPLAQHRPLTACRDGRNEGWRGLAHSTAYPAEGA
jgi:hypothetical protein